MTPSFFDITPLISEYIAVFPEDQPFRRQVHLDFHKGDHLALSAISSTVHLGAHADSPSHFDPHGKTMELQPLEYYFGPCQVIEVKTKSSARLYPADISTPITEPRVLFKTNSFPDPNQWTPHFNSLSPELIFWLKEKQVQTVGIDTPSVDPWDSKALESHQALRECQIANLEGLSLMNVPQGRYWLMALPLKIQGADGSPVRAVLINEDIVWKK